MKRLPARVPRLLAVALLVGSCLVPSDATARIESCGDAVFWRVGDVDTGFGIGRATFQRMVEAAASRWNELAGRELFVRSRSARFTVNLRYTRRQELAETVQELRADATEREQLLEDMVADARQLAREHAEDSARYERWLDEFDTAADELNRRMRRGGIGERERRKLLARRDDLVQIQADLDAERRRLNEMRSELLGLNREINTRVARHNDIVAEANRTMRESPREARQLGVMHIDGRRSKIELFQYLDDETLYITLLHELGHALGILHIADPRAIMHAERSERTAGDLTGSDLRALQAVCRLRR